MVLNMKKIALITLALLATACSTPQNTALILDKETHPMSRNEIILAVHECEGNGLRAVVVTSRRKINGHTSDVVVDVSCAPTFKAWK